MDIVNTSGPSGALDEAVTPPDELDTIELVKLINISGPSGELDGTPTLPDGRDTTKTVFTWDKGITYEDHVVL
ncbi:hypothetical protein Tco_1053152 [Tanacetum coccineum]